MRFGSYLFILASVLADLGAAPAPAAALPVGWLVPFSLLAPPASPHYTVTRLPLSLRNDQIRPLSASGQVIGHTASGAVLWDHGTIVWLGTLGGNLVWPQQINAAGQVIGQAAIGAVGIGGNGVYHAFVWENGTMTDLNNLLPDNPAAPYVDAESINDFGQIVVSRDGKGVAEAFLLTPG